MVHSNSDFWFSSRPRKSSWGTVIVELYPDIICSSVLAYGFSPINSCTSLYDAYSRLVGSFAKGDKLLKSKKEVDGCFNAADKNAWSVLRKETLFNGDPRYVSFLYQQAIQGKRTGEIIGNFCAKLSGQHGVNISVGRFRNFWLGHCRKLKSCQLVDVFAWSAKDEMYTRNIHMRSYLADA